MRKSLFCCILIMVLAAVLVASLASCKGWFEPAPVQDRLGYFHLENESATWHDPQTTRSPLPQGSPPTARYTVTITDGPDGMPQAEFTLVELSY